MKRSRALRSTAIVPNRCRHRVGNRTARPAYRRSKAAGVAAGCSRNMEERIGGVLTADETPSPSTTSYPGRRHERCAGPYPSGAQQSFMRSPHISCRHLRAGAGVKAGEGGWRGVAATCEDRGMWAAVQGAACRREGDPATASYSAACRSDAWVCVPRRTTVASDVATDVVTAVIPNQGTAFCSRSDRIASRDAQPHLEPNSGRLGCHDDRERIAYPCQPRHAGRPFGVGALRGRRHCFNEAVCEQVCGRLI